MPETTQPNRATVPSEPRVLVFVVACWLLFVWFSDQRYRPPSPLPANAPAERFSATRAEPIWELLVGESIPHPAGSPQNKINRERIVGLLESYGYDVQIQTGTGHVDSSVKNRYPNVGDVPLANIITRLKGKVSNPAVMLVAHFDSVPFGPGACDDGAGTTAVLEIARMLAEEPQPARDIIFLLTDGEEYGLLGAKLFVSEHAWASDVAVAVNLEARGSSGCSCMFQTSAHSRWLLPLFARVSNKPYASSLFFEVYKRMPRDTDFTILKNAGIQGYDFAFIGDVKNYHTADDNLANADRGSLQHMGDNALRLIRGLAESDLEHTPVGRVVYFDLFGWKIIWWPEHWSIILSLVALVLFGSYIVINNRLTNPGNETLPGNSSTRSGLGEICVSFGGVLVAVIVLLAVGWLVTRACSFEPRLNPPWPNHPLPYAFAYWLLALPLLCVVNLTVLRNRSLPSIVASVGLFWILFAVLTSFVFAGGSHLYVVPSLLLGLFGIAVARSPKAPIWIALAFPIAVGLMWLPLERLLYDAVGFRMANLMVFRVAIVMSALLPAIKCLAPQTLFRLAIAGTIMTTIAFLMAVVLG